MNKSINKDSHKMKKPGQWRIEDKRFFTYLFRFSFVFRKKKKQRKQASFSSALKLHFVFFTLFKKILRWKAERLTITHRFIFQNFRCKAERATLRFTSIHWQGQIAVGLQLPCLYVLLATPEPAVAILTLRKRMRSHRWNGLGAEGTMIEKREREGERKKKKRWWSWKDQGSD